MRHSIILVITQNGLKWLGSEKNKNEINVHNYGWKTLCKQFGHQSFDGLIIGGFTFREIVTVI
jgi:hypothetical protein